MAEAYHQIVVGLGVVDPEVASQAAAGGLAVASVEQNLGDPR